MSETGSDRPFLIFQLAATIAAMGELAGHAHRGSLTWPGQSAIVGLLGAALGHRRGGDFADLDALTVTVATFDAGVPMRDYHTVQTVPSAAARAPQSRPEALRAAGLKAKTTLTQRDYRTGCLYGVAVAGQGLDALKDALQAPVFPLYLGRKACPLAAPLDPQIVNSSGPVAALCRLRLPPWALSSQIHLVAGFPDDLGDAARTEVRQDQAIDRGRWHFRQRRVVVLAPNVAAGRAEG